MRISNLSIRRPLTSYAAVQGWVGNLVRNQRWQLRRARLAGLAYLDLGCGPNVHENFINLDYLWHPRIDVCWDVTRGLPWADGSLQGIFSEHCLEHFTLATAVPLLRELRRALRPGGVVRLIVPDGELYLRAYLSQSGGNRSEQFPYQASEAVDPLWTPMTSVNRVFYQDRESLFGHRVIYDYAMLATLLTQCGFTKITKRSFREGADPELLIDSPSRQVESLYVEASVPPAA